MSFTRDIFLILLLGLFVQSNDINLANNQTILLILLMILALNSEINNDCHCCNNRTLAAPTPFAGLFPGQFNHC